MTIDEVIDEMKELSQPCYTHCGDKYIACEKCRSKPKQIAEWLKELKELREQIAEMQCEKQADFVFMAEHDKETYNKAIDDFINTVSESIIWDILAEVMKRNIGASESADRIIDYLQSIAEQLKDGE